MKVKEFFKKHGKTFAIGGVIVAGIIGAGYLLGKIVTGYNEDYEALKDQVKEEIENDYNEWYAKKQEENAELFARLAEINRELDYPDDMAIIFAGPRSYYSYNDQGERTEMLLTDDGYYICPAEKVVE